MSWMTVEETAKLTAGRGLQAKGRVLAEAEFFQDHFPGFPILPGVLALEILKRTAEHYLKMMPQPITDCFLESVEQTRFSHYLRPGDAWESRLELVEERCGRTQWKAQLFHDEKIAVSAKMTLASKTPALSPFGHEGGPS